MKVWRAVLVMLLMVSVGSALFIAPARAQSGNCDYPRVWDFSAGDYAGWTIQHGTQTANGAEPVYINGTTKLLQMTLMCDEPWGNPRKFLYGFWSSHGWAGIRPYSLALLDENGDAIDGWENLGQGSGAAGQGWWEYSGNFSAVYGIQIYFQWGTSETYWVNYFEINHTTPVPTATPVFTSTPTLTPVSPSGWANPIRVQDAEVSQNGVYAADSPFLEVTGAAYEDDFNAHIAYSETIGVNVHAAAEGTVASVRPLSGSCDQILGAPDGYCFISNSQPSGAGFWYRYASFESAYVVHLGLGDGRSLKYVVAFPQVSEGDTVQQGCILGKTLPYRFSAGLEVAEAAHGYVLVQGLDEDSSPFDLRDWFTQEPQPRVCANEDPGLDSTCALVADPTFTGDARWEWLRHPNGGVLSIQPSGGAGLVGVLQQRLNLDPGAQYAINLVYTPLVPNPRAFEISLGTETPVTIYDSEAVLGIPITKTIPAQSYTPFSSDEIGNWYWLELESSFNLAEPEVILNHICVVDILTGDPQPSGGCLLFNHEFDQQDFWDKTAPSGGGPAPSFQSGLAIMVDGASISQALKLSPKESGPQGYLLSVYARRAGTNSGTQNIDLTWAWGSEGGTMEGYLSGPVQEVRDTFTVSLSQSNDLILTVDATDSPSVSTLHIDRVCILTEDGVKPPGYLDPPPIIASCKICAYVPTGDLAADLNEFVGWLGCLLTQLWDCHLKTVLLGIWTAVTNILIFLGHMRLWLSLTLGNIAVWFNSNLLVVARWLEGTLKNIAAQIYLPMVIRDDGKGFWDVISDLITYGVGGFLETLRAAIDNLGVLFSQLIGGVFGLAAAIISVMGALIGMVINAISGLLLTVIGSLVSIIIAFINGMNAVPAAAPDWIPNCADPGMGDLICYGFYMLDTEFQTGTGSILLAVIIGLASLDLLVWAVGRFMRVFGGD